MFVYIYICVSGCTCVQEFAAYVCVCISTHTQAHTKTNTTANAYTQRHICSPACTWSIWYAQMWAHAIPHMSTHIHLREYTHAHTLAWMHTQNTWTHTLIKLCMHTRVLSHIWIHIHLLTYSPIYVRTYKNARMDGHKRTHTQTYICACMCNHVDPPSDNLQSKDQNTYDKWKPF